MIAAFFIGILLGFLAAVPIAGPIAALILSRALRGQYRPAFQVALGSALAESVYAGVAFYGIGSLPFDLSEYGLWIDGLAAIILLIVGIALIRAGKNFTLPQEDDAPPSTGSSLLLGFSLCALNPTLLATWSSMIVPVHSGGWVESGIAPMVMFMVGVIGGALAWNGSLMFFVRWLRGKLQDTAIGRVQIVTGVLVLCASAYFGVRAIGALL